MTDYEGRYQVAEHESAGERVQDGEREFEDG